MATCLWELYDTLGTVGYMTSASLQNYVQINVDTPLSMTVIRGCQSLSAWNLAAAMNSIV